QEFEARTQLSELRPESQISLTVPGLYNKLLEHVDVHRWYLGEKQGQEVPLGEAVSSWYDNIYLPLVGFIREQDVLVEFPGRTEADLYLWILEQQAYLQQSFGEDVPLEVAIDKFTERKSIDPNKMDM
ncbi:unnamed protein product, partial [marine sediment metagenome]